MVADIIRKDKPKCFAKKMSKVNQKTVKMNLRRKRRVQIKAPIKKIKLKGIAKRLS